MSATITIETSDHTQGVDITRQVQEAVEAACLSDGVCVVYVTHTTAAVAVNEAADPAVMEDVFAALDRLVPWDGPYAHKEGNSAAHIKSVLVGSSVHLPVYDGRLQLGTWQGIFFMEFDGPRRRRVLVKTVTNDWE